MKLNITLLSLATLLITACSVKSVTPNLFKTGESMVVHYSSQGCFSHDENLLVFQENNVTIYKMLNDWNQKIDKQKMGTLTLTEKDKERINNLFTYYEGERSGRCTTTEDIEVKRYRGGKLISTKNITDSSCGEYGDIDALNFRELIYRLKKRE